MTYSLVLIFWLSAIVVAYAYAVYPFLIWALSRLFGRRLLPKEDSHEAPPSASLLLAAYNEEAVIRRRLINALAMDYPTDRLEILVGSDGSTDRTAERVRGFEARGVRLLDFAENHGKATVLNALASEAMGEILLMSDANTDIDPAAARKLIRWFRDPEVGSVVGRLVLVDPRTGSNADGLYWKYETFLKRCEGRLGALLGANGAIYAIRKALYTPIPPDTIVDDFIIPLRAKLRTGCQIIYDCEAFAVEETAADVRAEFHRRSRIGAGGFQSIGMLWRLFSPTRGWIAFTFLSHKVLRWLCPFFLIAAIASCMMLIEHPVYRLALFAQIAFYTLSLVMTRVPANLGVLRPLRLTTMFTSMNIALFVGFWRWLFGRQKGTWKRTGRPIETESVAG
jgi:cellulose synthase/poly-beta-1,6-N-acetylglucosamine synthase-like glycosyltransferase